MLGLLGDPCVKRIVFDRWRMPERLVWAPDTWIDQVTIRVCQLQVLDTGTQWRKIHTQFVLYSLRLTRYSVTTEYVFSSDESGKPTLGQSHLHFFRWRAIAAPVPSWKSFEEKFVFMPFANALQKKYPGPFTRNRRVCIFAYQLSVHFLLGRSTLPVVLRRPFLTQEQPVSLAPGVLNVPTRYRRW